MLRKTIQDPYTMCGRKVLVDAYALLCNGVSVYVWKDALAWLCAVPLVVDVPQHMRTEADQGLGSDDMANIRSENRIRQGHDTHIDKRVMKDRDGDVGDTRAHVVGDGNGVDVTWGSEIFGSKWQHLRGVISDCVAAFLRMSESECMDEHETEDRGTTSRPSGGQNVDQHTRGEEHDTAHVTTDQNLAGNNKKPPMQIICVRFEVAAGGDAVRMVEASPGVDLNALRKSRVWKDADFAEESPYERFGAWMG